MSNHKTTLGLVVFSIVAIFIVGCIPEDSLQWSEDGSVGLLKAGDGLYLVDGKTGELTEVAKGPIDLLPGLSADGTWIAYCERVECTNLAEGLKRLPPEQVEAIAEAAEQIAEKIQEAGALKKNEFPSPDEGPLVLEDYENWAIRTLCENADGALRKIIGPEGINKGSEMPLEYFQVVVVAREAPKKKKIVATNIFHTFATKFSPDGKYIAYLMHTQEGEVSNAYEEFSLHVTATEGDKKVVSVDSCVAFGYDWRKDSRAIAYLRADSEDLSHDDLILGTLSETVVADANGNLLVESAHDSAGSDRFTGKTAELAGTMFLPWLKVEYGIGHRIFFSSAALSLPVNKKDEAKCSLFCYDPVTGTVSDVLPLSVSIHTSQQILNLSQFSLSPDGKKVLLPVKYNRFIVYALGTDSMDIPIREEEGFGEEELSELAPSWKGNNEFSCLVAGKSTFLPKPKDDQDEADRREIVVLGKDGNTLKAWILSHDWPDEMKRDSQDNQ